MTEKDEDEAFLLELKATQSEGLRDVVKYFDRIHDNLVTFNNMLIGGFFALSTLTNQIPRLTILVPILNMALLLFIEYRMMEKSRFEANVLDKNFSQIEAHGKRIRRTTLFSLLTIVSTTLVTLYFLFNLFFVGTGS